MSKSFTAAPKPKLPTDEQIAAFERGGVGHDTKPTNGDSHRAPNVDTHNPPDGASHNPPDEGNHKGSNPGSHKTGNVGSRKSSNVGSTKAVTQEPTKRLSLDLPTSVHTRFKTACSATDTKMVREVMDFIERKTVELEKRAGLKR